MSQIREESATSDEVRKLGRTTFFATLGVLLSRLSGLVRTQVITALFGASTSLDAFWVAFRFPNTLRDLFAEGALSAAFTKVYVEAREEGGAAERKLVAVVTAVFGLVTLAIALLSVVFASDIIALGTALEFKERGGFELSVSFFKVLAFYLPISMFSAVAMSMLGALRMTFRATIASAFFNLGTIAGALLGPLLATHLSVEPILGLVWGTMAGGVLQFGYQAYPLVKRHLFPFPWASLKDITTYGPLKNVALLMGPRAIAQGAFTLALFINTNFTTEVGKGAMVYVSNAQTIILVPVGLFGVAAGLSSLPVLTEKVLRRDFSTFSRLLSEGLHSTLWLALCTILGLALLAFPFSILVYEHGRFLRSDALETALAIQAYSIGILFNSGSKVLQPGFFAFGKTRQVVFNSIVYLCLNASLSAYLAPRLGIVGLGLSNSIAALSDFSLNAYMLSRLAKREGAGALYLASSGKSLVVRMFTYGVLAFVFGVAGVALSKLVWNDALNGVSSLGVLSGFVFATLLLGALIWALTLRVGPQQLCEQLRRVQSKVSRKLGSRR